MKKSAFTLVELMVAMAIIGVLLGLAVFGVSAAQMSQRNTERKAALQDINLGIQQYVDSYGVNPEAIFFDVTSKAAYIGPIGTTASCTTGCIKVPLKGSTIPSSSSVNVTTAKSSGTMTKYYFDTTCTGGYALVACVENSTTPFSVGTCTGDNGGAPATLCN